MKHPGRPVTRRSLRLGAALVLSAAVLALGVAPVGPDAATVSAQTPPALGAGGEYHPLGPVRIFDSRPESAVNDPRPGKKKLDTPNGFKVQVAGQGGLPAAKDILAVVVNVTVVEPGGPGWLAIRPTGGTAGSSLVNFAAGRNVPNTGIVGVGTDGTVTVTMGAKQNASAHVVIDLYGWVSKSSYTAQRGTRLVSMGPARLLDTRETRTPIAAGENRVVQIRGASTYSPRLTIPNDATAVLVNIGAVNNRPGSQSTFLSSSPKALVRPVTTSNVNVVPGQIKTGLAVVPVGTDGKIRLFNHAGSIDVTIDVFGYFVSRPDNTTTGRIVPLSSPFRAFDTREPSFGAVPLGRGTSEDWSFKAFAGSVALGSQTGLAQGALIGNIAATDLRRTLPATPVSTYLTLYPGAINRPLVSNLNIGEAEVVSNMGLVTYGTERSDPYSVQTYNHDGSVHYVFDAYAIVLD